MDRRQLLTRTAAVVLLAGFDPIARSWVRADAAVPNGMEPLPELDGIVVMDESALAADSSDEGNMVHRRPWAILRPGSAEDIQKMILFCRRNELSVAARGEAHTVFGQSLVADGLVVETTALATIHRIEADHAEVDAGVLWQDLVTAAVDQGVTPRVLTGYTALTIGGTLSVGGIGGGTGSGGRRGAMVDYVRELEVVTGAGDIVRCSPTQHSDLFEGVLAGLGQLGIITRAWVDLEPAPARVSQWSLVYADPKKFFRDLRIILERDEFDNVYGQIAFPALALISDPSPLVLPLSELLPIIEAITSPIMQGVGSVVTVPALALPTPWLYLLNVGKYHEVGERPRASTLLRGMSDLSLLRQHQDRPYLDYTQRVDVLISTLKAAGLWNGTPRPWLDLFLPGPVTEQFATQTFRELKFDDVGLGGFGLLFPLRRSLLKRRFFAIPESPTDWVYLFDVLTSAPIPGPNSDFVAEKLARNRRLYERARAVGGTFYPISAVPMEAADWSQQYGSRYAELLSLKDQYDPDGILTPGIRFD